MCQNFPDKGLTGPGSRKTPHPTLPPGPRTLEITILLQNWPRTLKIPFFSRACGALSIILFYMKKVIIFVNGDIHFPDRFSSLSHEFRTPPPIKPWKHRFCMRKLNRNLENRDPSCDPKNDSKKCCKILWIAETVASNRVSPGLLMIFEQSNL